MNRTAIFTALALTHHYDITHPDDGRYMTQGIQGADAMRALWPEGAEAFEAGVDASKAEAVEEATTDVEDLYDLDEDSDEAAVMAAAEALEKAARAGYASGWAAQIRAQI